MTTTNDDADTADYAAFLAQLSPEERQEAIKAAEIAKRAEQRAEQRALERAMQQKREERQQQQQQHTIQMKDTMNSNNNPAATTTSGSNKLVYVPKRKRGNNNNNPDKNKEEEEEANNSNNKKAKMTTNEGQHPPVLAHTKKTTTTATAAPAPTQSERERLAVRETYLGKSALELQQQRQQEELMQKRRNKPSNKKKITFKFRWDESEDTFNNNDDDILYAPMAPRRTNTSSSNTKHQKQQVSNSHNQHRKPTASSTSRRGGGGGAGNVGRQMKRIWMTSDVASMDTVLHKPLAKMTDRDWRIFCENYEITVRGGKAPPPMRSFHESPLGMPTLHPSLLDAIDNVLKFKEPSPIQRQAIPIGLQRRDLIGKAETGSGKTIAFGVPLCHYLLHLPDSILNSVADQGPLALVMAPTRELALQIDEEMAKLLSRQTKVRTCAVVGGQSIQQQAQSIRTGVHIIVGTPGRINDCIEMAYLVLNQCSYIVMDEADS